MNQHLAKADKKLTYWQCETCKFGASVQAPARCTQLYIHKELRETVKAQGIVGL